MNKRNILKLTMIASGLLTSILAFLAIIGNIIGWKAVNGIVATILIIACNVAYYYGMSAYFTEEEADA